LEYSDNNFLALRFRKASHFGHEFLNSRRQIHELLLAPLNQGPLGHHCPGRPVFAQRTPSLAAADINHASSRAMPISATTASSSGQPASRHHTHGLMR
jgi:hypothetical protein